MGMRTITQPLYQVLLEAFREAPGNYTRCAKKTGVGYVMCRRAWLRGWPERYSWALPIQSHIEGEREAARAAQHREAQAKVAAAQEERDAARNDAVMALAQEGKMLGAGRMVVLSSLASITQAVPAIRKLVEQIRDAILDGKVGDVQSAMRILRDFTTCAKSLVESADHLIESERRHKGEPSTVIGLDLGGDATIEESIAMLDHVSSTWALAKKRGLAGAQEPDEGESGAGNGNGGVH